MILSRPPASPVRPEDLQDPRIAVVIPPDLDDDAQVAAAEYLACQKMEEYCENRNGPDAEEMRAWLATKRAGVLRNLPLKQASLYRSATVVTRDGLAIDLREALGKPDTDQRLGAIADRLLKAAYRDLPLDPARLRGVLRSNDVGKLYDGLFGRAETSAARAAVRNYGIGLGLVDPDAPGGFRPTACRAFDLIAAMLDEYQNEGRELPVWRIYERLANAPYGLPYPLIQLYLLAFVRHGQPPVELTLKPGHALRLRDYYAALERQRTRLEDAARSLHALALLNAIPELGDPVGGDLAARYETLRERLQPCQVTQVADVNVTARPTCAACGLPLDARDPIAEVEAFLGDLDRALQEQRRRLSAEAARRVLERAGGDELSRLVEAARAAEIARLVGVLDERVAESIQRLLVEDGLVTAPADVFARLAELHPTVGEDEIPAATRDFERLLREALKEAKKAHPGKKTVRVSLR